MAGVLALDQRKTTTMNGGWHKIACFGRFLCGRPARGEGLGLGLREKKPGKMKNEAICS
jgi:hypothetical protein